MSPCLRCILKLDRALELEGGDGSDVEESGVSSSSDSVDDGDFGLAAAPLPTTFNIVARIIGQSLKARSFGQFLEDKTARAN